MVGVDPVDLKLVWPSVTCLPRIHALSVALGAGSPSFFGSEALGLFSMKKETAIVAKSNCERHINPTVTGRHRKMSVRFLYHRVSQCPAAPETLPHLNSDPARQAEQDFP